MARTPPLLLAWVTYALMFSSAFILLGAISASQRFCGSAAANSLLNAGGASYFANVSCDKLYRLTWFTVWYQIAMIIVVPVVLAMGAVHKWRYGLIGLLVPVTYLLMETANAFFLQKLNIDSNKAASRAMLAGAILGCISNYVLIILFGVRDEKARAVEK
ncbi:hypothetical protein Ndes2526B_g07722 [Nannochloris sp. 'desiccata']|nr:hypothetical protein KSW81_002393 [Chlorella desiccata (nom. nud.)]KAH7617131.1 hypothetical protein NADE_006917 [Chlorella desiccata (nom. nud.)]